MQWSRIFHTPYFWGCQLSSALNCTIKLKASGRKNLHEDKHGAVTSLLCFPSGAWKWSQEGYRAPLFSASQIGLTVNLHDHLLHSSIFFVISIDLRELFLFCTRLKGALYIMGILLFSHRNATWHILKHSLKHGKSHAMASRCVRIWKI